MKCNEAIDEVLRIRHLPEKNRPWIYDNEGNITALCGDIIPVLKEMTKYEVPSTMEDIEAFKARGGTENFYTYNCSGNVDRDFSIWYNEESPFGIMYIHTGAEAQYGFTDAIPFVIDSDRNNALEQFFQAFESLNQSIDINDKYEANISLLSDEYEIFDKETGQNVGTFTEPDKSLLLDEIEQTEER